jgi:ribosomal protein L21E
MKRHGLKLTYALNQLDGVRDSIEYEIGDLVYLYAIDESYRRLHPFYKYDGWLCRVIEVKPSQDGLHLEQYGLQRVKDKCKIYWFYPTYMEPAFEAN